MPVPFWAGRPPDGEAAALETNELESTGLSMTELAATELAIIVLIALDAAVAGSSGEYVNIGGV